MKFTHFFKQDDRDIAAQIRSATNISMDDTARERMRAHLFEYTRMRPIRTKTSAAHWQISEYWLSTFLASRIRRAPVVAALLIVAVSGGTVAAAETALPGDVLYPVKVHVTEEVRASLAVSPKSKADWAMNRAERRLEEAATLALSGKLDDATRAELDTNLNEHVRSANENRQKLEDENDSLDASEIEKNIGAVRIARANIIDGRRSKPRTTKILARIEVATDTTAAMMRMAEEPQETLREKENRGTLDESETVTRGHRTAAKARIEATKKFLERGTDHLNSDAREKARAHLKNATEAFATGDIDVARGNNEEASSKFDSALQAATEIQTLISNSDDSNNDSKDRSDDDPENGTSSDGDKERGPSGSDD